MKKTLRKIQLFLLSLLSFFALSSCSSFFSDEGMVIESITTKTDEEGDTTITIAFTDDFYDPVTFTIPAPEDGKEGPQGPIGNGIEKIEKVTKDGKDYLRVTFTDKSLEPALIELPKTVSIQDITTSYDAKNETNTVTITLTDGTKESFVLQNGKDGLGIQDIQSTTDEEGNTTITISYTDESKEDTVIQIPYIQGKDGKGIDQIVSYTDPIENKYYIYITYTDGQEETLQFDAPNRGTLWYAGDGEPNPRVNPELYQAIQGDFYFDLTNLTIYRYNGRSWDSVGSLGAKEENVTVTFDASTNGGAIVGATLSYTLEKGNVIPAVDMPLAYKEGATFIGWYTSANGPNNPNAGHFTSLTPVFSSMTVYACFEGNE